MREVGNDLALARPQKLTPKLASRAPLLVTSGCGEACPVVPRERAVEVLDANGRRRA